MSNADDNNVITDLEKDFDLLRATPEERAAYEKHREQDLEWKRHDPVGYKQDMENMCKQMFGDNWEKEYQAMLREEFPEEFES